MVELEDLEAPDQTRLGGAEERKELMVLDLMVAVQMGQHRLQARRQPRPELLGGQAAFAELGRRRGERAAEVAEAVVDLQPEARHRAEIGVTGPDLARVAVKEQPEIGRPALSGIEVERHGASMDCRVDRETPDIRLRHVR